MFTFTFLKWGEPSRKCLKKEGKWEGKEKPIGLDSGSAVVHRTVAFHYLVPHFTTLASSKTAKGSLDERSHTKEIRFKFCVRLDCNICSFTASAMRQVTVLLFGMLG